MNPICLINGHKESELKNLKSGHLHVYRCERKWCRKFRVFRDNEMETDLDKEFELCLNKKLKNEY